MTITLSVYWIPAILCLLLLASLPSTGGTHEERGCAGMIGVVFIWLGFFTVLYFIQ